MWFACKPFTGDEVVLKRFLKHKGVKFERERVVLKVGLLVSSCGSLGVAKSLDACITLHQIRLQLLSSWENRIGAPDASTVEPFFHTIRRRPSPIIQFSQRQGLKAGKQHSIPFVGVIPRLRCLVLGRGSKNLRQVCSWFIGHHCMWNL